MSSFIDPYGFCYFRKRGKEMNKKIVRKILSATAISGVSRGGANGRLPISFDGLPIVIFISKLLPIEILLS